MYEAHFGLRQRPFPSTPDPGCYYPATTHERGLGRLLRGLADGEGLLALTGAPGTGKTLLAQCMVERLGPEVQPLFLTNGRMGDRVSLLQAILFDLSLPYEGKGEQELRLAVTDRLLDRLGDGGRTVLVFDEAHHLPADLLEELRLLGNLETRAGRAVQVVLVGQPALLDTLRQPALAALNQRLTARAELGRLSRDESADYLLHHLRVAGARPEALIGDEALDLLARGGAGLPRLLDQSAHLALALTWQAGAGRVDAEGALEALARLGLDDGPAEELAPSVAPPSGETLADAPVSGAPTAHDGTDDPEYRWPPGAYRLPPPPRLTYAPGTTG